MEKFPDNFNENPEEKAEDASFLARRRKEISSEYDKYGHPADYEEHLKDTESRQPSSTEVLELEKDQKNTPEDSLEPEKSEIDQEKYDEFLEEEGAQRSDKPTPDKPRESKRVI